MRITTGPPSAVEQGQEQPEEDVQGDRDQHHRRDRDVYPCVAAAYPDITRKVPQPGQGSRPGEEPADEQQQSSADEPRAPIPRHRPTFTLCTSDAIVVASRAVGPHPRATVA